MKTLVCGGIHARTVGPELLEMAAEFAELKRRASVDTPTLGRLLSHVARAPASLDREELAS